MPKTPAAAKPAEAPEVTEEYVAEEVETTEEIRVPEPHQVVFGYLTGTHTVSKKGKLLSEQSGELDGQKVITVTYELIEEVVTGEQPWLLDSVVGRVQATAPYASRKLIESSAPAGYTVVWKDEPPAKRGRKRKPKPAAPATPTEEAPKSEESDADFEEL